MISPDPSRPRERSIATKSAARATSALSHWRKKYYHKTCGFCHVSGSGNRKRHQESPVVIAVLSPFLSSIFNVTFRFASRRASKGTSLRAIRCAIQLAFE